MDFFDEITRDMINHHNSMNGSVKKTIRYTTMGLGFGIVIYLGIVVTVLIVAVHFIAKFW